MKHKTINANFKLEKGKDLDFKYQEELTKKLDETNSKFTQAILNEIVLWKVNRYALFNSTLINEINTISSWKVLNKEKTREILTSLLKILINERIA